MKERTQQQVEEAKVLLQVRGAASAHRLRKRSEGAPVAELSWRSKNASKAMLVEAQAEADAQLAKAKAAAEETAAVGAARSRHIAIQAKGQAGGVGMLKEKNQTYQYMGEEAGITGHRHERDARDRRGDRRALVA